MGKKCQRHYLYGMLILQLMIVRRNRGTRLLGRIRLLDRQNGSNSCSNIIIIKAQLWRL